MISFFLFAVFYVGISSIQTMGFDCHVLIKDVLAIRKFYQIPQQWKHTILSDILLSDACITFALAQLLGM